MASSNNEFRDKLIKIALPRLIIDLFDRGVDFQLIKCYGQHMLYQEQLDEMLKIDENGENHTGDMEIKAPEERIICSCTRLLELIELAKKDLTDIKQEYTNAMESRACADI